MYTHAGECQAELYADQIIDIADEAPITEPNPDGGFLSSLTHMPVVDETGLKGAYNLHLKWQREEEEQSSGLHDQALPTIYAALPEQLGLKLDSGKGPVEVLVIDNIEQPSEN